MGHSDGGKSSVKILFPRQVSFVLGGHELLQHQCRKRELGHISNLSWHCEPDFQAWQSSQATVSEEQMERAIVRYYKHLENGSAKPSGLRSDSRGEGEKATT